MRQTKKSLSLFSCIGGSDIASHLLGFETIATVEKDTLFQSVLRLRFPKAESFSDIKAFSGEKFYGIDLLTSGFPCTSISTIGKQNGFAKDSGTESSLAWEMVRVISESQPKLVFIENVANFTSRKFSAQREELFDALTSLGYGGKWVILGAQHVGAPHRRNRFWLLLQKQANPEIQKSKHVFPNIKNKHAWPTPRSSGANGFSFKRRDGKIRDHITDVVLMSHLKSIGWTEENIFTNAKVKEYFLANQLHVNARWVECVNGLPEGWLDLGCKKPKLHIGSDGRQLFPSGVGETQKPWEPSRLCNKKANSKIISAIGNIQVPAQAKLAFEILSKEMGIDLDNSNQMAILASNHNDNNQ